MNSNICWPILCFFFLPYLAFSAKRVFFRARRERVINGVDEKSPEPGFGLVSPVLSADKEFEHY